MPTGAAGDAGTALTAAAPDLRPMGALAVLLTLPTLEDVIAWHAELTARPVAGQVEALAAARTVLVGCVSPAAAAAALGALAARTPGAARSAEGQAVQIEVVYDGEDLEEVARLTGFSPQGVIDAHTGTAWTAAFGGFAPGFTYLTGGDARLQVPRRSTPRTAVPAGSVALAGEYSAVYPGASPGGWQLIGRTDAPLWRTDRAQPALIAPGDTVRFVAVREQARVGAGAGAVSADGQAPPADGAGSAQRDADAATPLAPAATAALAPALHVLDPGLRTLVQDLGRPGRGDLGVTASGAADAPSARQANRLVGNDEGAAVLESLLGGTAVRAGEQALVLALSGAPASATISPSAADERPDRPDLTPDRPGRPDRPAPHCAPFALYPGETLRLAPPAAGLRTYLAVRGGIDVPPVLGSRATDTLSGIGPAPLAGGDVLPVGTEPHRAVGPAETPATTPPAAGERAVLRMLPGPRADWFGEGGAQQLCAREWRVGPASDRVGVRLALADEAGAPLQRERDGELASEGMAPGAIQVPPSGLPVVFLADHPVTGGYPVIAVVHPDDLPRLAQLAPGTAVRFALHDAPTPAPASPQETS
nr:carboxyltransferase domain-containing protein [Brachybacterium equifaecis]